MMGIKMMVMVAQQIVSDSLVMSVMLKVYLTIVLVVGTLNRILVRNVMMETSTMETGALLTVKWN